MREERGERREERREEKRGEWGGEKTPTVSCLRVKRDERATAGCLLAHNQGPTVVSM